MVVLRVTSIIPFLLLVQRVCALQVTPNSPCAYLCLNPTIQDVSDPNASNTTGSEIACLDASFSDSIAGQRFKSCVSCLQNSTAFDHNDGNDQAWFIYNLRYALGSCLFGFANATDSVSTPCSTSPSCGPLQGAIESGNFIQSNETAYSYCSADENAILGSHLPLCIECLQSGGTEVYLSNFLIALQAGCVQQPPSGTVIGLDGTVFSTTPVNITSPGSIPGVQKKYKKPLSQGAIIGIVVALCVLVIATLAIIFICYRKRQALDRMKLLTSPLDPRLGAPNITSPNTGALENKFIIRPIVDSRQFSAPAFSTKELAARGRETPISISQISETEEQNGWQDAHAHLASQPPIYTSSSIPKHQAYIESPPLDYQHGSSFALPTYPSAKTSPNFPSSRSSPNCPPSRTSPNCLPSRPSPHYPPSRTSPDCPPSHFSPNYPPSRTSPDCPPSLVSPEYPPSRTSPAYTNYIPSRPAPSHPPSRTSPAYTNYIPSRPAPSLPPPIKTQTSLSRTISRNYGLIAGAKSKDAATTISGPMIQHSGRFELSERERQHQAEQEAANAQKPNHNWSPESAVSEEQWPGSY